MAIVEPCQFCGAGNPCEMHKAGNVFTASDPELARLRAENEEAEEHIASLKSEMGAMTDRYDREAEALREEVERLKADNEQLRQHLLAAATRVDRLCGELDEREAERDEATAKEGRHRKAWLDTLERLARAAKARWEAKALAREAAGLLNRTDECDEEIDAFLSAHPELTK